ncbi:hypothetical protein SPRG_21265, partial [Saprolegnia parasitica CBS 223.65]
ARVEAAVADVEAVLLQLDADRERVLGRGFSVAHGVVVGGDGLHGLELRELDTGKLALKVHDDLGRGLGVTRRLAAAKREERHNVLLVVRLEEAPDACVRVVLELIEGERRLERVKHVGRRVHLVGVHGGLRERGHVLLAELGNRVEDLGRRVGRANRLEVISDRRHTERDQRSFVLARVVVLGELGVAGREDVLDDGVVLGRNDAERRVDRRAVRGNDGVLNPATARVLVKVRARVSVPVHEVGDLLGELGDRARERRRRQGAEGNDDLDHTGGSW